MENTNRRNITFMYPIESKADSLKVFKDLNSQIRGIYFTKTLLNEASKEPHANDYCIYFYLD